MCGGLYEVSWWPTLTFRGPLNGEWSPNVGFHVKRVEPYAPVHETPRNPTFRGPRRFSFQRDQQGATALRPTLPWHLTGAPVKDLPHTRQMLSPRVCWCVQGELAEVPPGAKCKIKLVTLLDGSLLFANSGNGAKSLIPGLGILGAGTGVVPGLKSGQLISGNNYCNHTYKEASCVWLVAPTCSPWMNIQMVSHQTPDFLECARMSKARIP